MKKLIELGDRFAAQSDWKDFALTKFCLSSMGVLIGTFVPKKRKKAARGIAGGIFTVTYALLMTKVVLIALKMGKEE